MIVIQNLYLYVYIELIAIALTNVGNSLYIKEFLSTRTCADSVQCQDQSLLSGQSSFNALIWGSDRLFYTTQSSCQEDSSSQWFHFICLSTLFSEHHFLHNDVFVFSVCHLHPAWS